MVHCEACGAQNDPGGKFCGGCGRGLSEASDAAPPGGYAPQPPQPTPGKGILGTVRWVGAAIAAVVLVLAGVFVTKAVTGGAAAAQGAKSPQDAATRFVTALEKKDPVGLLDSLDPEETPGLTSLLDASRTKLASTGKTRKDHEFDGVTVQLKDLSSTTTTLGPRVARVTYTAGYGRIVVDHSKLAPLLNQMIPQSWSAGSATAEQVEQDTHSGNGSTPVLSLMTTRTSSGWWVSPLYTVAELERSARGSDIAPPTYSSQEAKAVTEKTPQEAATKFLNTLAGGDVDGAISRLTPGEQTFVQDYSAVWRGPLQEARSGGYWPTGTITAQTSTKKLGDGQVGVVIESATGSWQSNIKVNDSECLEYDDSGVCQDWNNTSHVQAVHGAVTLSGPDLRVSSDQDSSLNGTNWLTKVLTFGQDQRLSAPPQTPRLIIDTVKVKDGYAVSLVGSYFATEQTAVDGIPSSDWVSMLRLNQPGN